MALPSSILNAQLLVAMLAVFPGAATCHAAPNAPPDTNWEKVDLGGLQNHTSQEGVLSITLTVTAADVHIGNTHFPGMVYNGTYAGPVLRVHAGDTVHIKLQNNLPEPTNLHFHGLRISPRDRGDNMHLTVLPMSALDYSFVIPKDHPPGLFWFHDHIHGMTSRHVMAGLGGTILIDGFARQFGGLKDAGQKLIVLKDFADPGCTEPTLKLAHCRVVSINGGEMWHDTLAIGQAQIWRIANEGANFILHLGAPGLHLRIIGRDGVATVKAEEASALDIMPASRLDVLVTAETPGQTVLSALHVPTGAGAGFTPSRPVGTITVTGDHGPPAPVVVSFPAQQDLRPLHIDMRREVTFSEDATSTHYMINGRTFQHDRIDVRVPLGNVEEWTVRNATQDFHEFHIHQLGFQVTEINGIKQEFNGFIDDVQVPEMGEVKVIIPFTDPIIVGSFMFHCHVLTHEDGGMMANIEVYNPGHSPVPAICHVPQQPGAATLP